MPLPDTPSSEFLSKMRLVFIREPVVWIIHHKCRIEAQEPRGQGGSDAQMPFGREATRVFTEVSRRES